MGIISSTEIIYPNTIVPLPEQSDAISEKVEKACGDLYDIIRLVQRSPPSHIENHHVILIYIKVSNDLLLFHYIFANR